MSGEKFSTNKVYVTNGVKKLNPHSLEWRTHYPKIHKALTSAGLVVGTKGEKQVIRLTFGVKDLPENVVNRFVNFSGMNGEDEVWKLSVSSRGTSRDFARVLPVLLTASYDAVSEPGNESRSFVLSEEDLGVIAFTHHLAQ
jgi:hypothetical protein